MVEGPSAFSSPGRAGWSSEDGERRVRCARTRAVTSFFQDGVGGTGMGAVEVEGGRSVVSGVKSILVGLKTAAGIIPGVVPGDNRGVKDSQIGRQARVAPENPHSALLCWSCRAR